MTEEEIIALPLHERPFAIECLARADLAEAKANFIDTARTILFVGGLAAIVICALLALESLT